MRMHAKSEIIIIIIIVTIIIVIIILLLLLYYYYDYYYYIIIIITTKYYRIDRRIYLNLSKSTRSAAGLKVFEDCCQWISIYCTEVHLSSFQQSACWVLRVSVIHRTLT